MAARAMTPNEITPEFSLATLKDDEDILKQVLTRFEMAATSKLIEIKNQTDLVGEAAVSRFSNAIANFYNKWCWILPDETMASAIEIVEAFEAEDVSDLRYRIPKDRGGLLEEKDMTPEQLEMYYATKEETDE